MATNSDEAQTVPLPFPDRSKGVRIRTSSGHVHDLRPGWVTLDVDGTVTDTPSWVLDYVGVAEAGYLVAIAADHVESRSQAGPDQPMNTDR